MHTQSPGQCPLTQTDAEEKGVVINIQREKRGEEERGKRKHTEKIQEGMKRRGREQTTIPSGAVYMSSRGTEDN